MYFIEYSTDLNLLQMKVTGTVNYGVLLCIM